MTKKKSKRKYSTRVNANGRLTGKLEYNHKQMSTIKRLMSCQIKEV